MVLLVYEALRRHGRFFKFVASGATVAVVNLTTLSLFTELLGVWYLTSSILAYIVSFFVNFFLQKFWTFQDHEKHRTTFKMWVFFLNSLVNLILNALLMYTLVEVYSLWYVLAQCLVIGILMIMNYTVYRLYIFHPTSSQ
jgi:putative flippase GtrA